MSSKGLDQFEANKSYYYYFYYFKAFFLFIYF